MTPEDWFDLLQEHKIGFLIRMKARYRRKQHIPISRVSTQGIRAANTTDGTRPGANTMSPGASITISNLISIFGSNFGTGDSAIGSMAIPDSKYTCLGEGCVVSCNKWNPMMLHMKNCRYFHGYFCSKNRNLTMQLSREKNEGLKQGAANAPTSAFSAPAAAIQNPRRKTKEANSDDDTISAGASNTISNSGTVPSAIGSMAIPDSTYTCLGEGCVVSFKKWKPMKLHMNNCQYFSGDFSGFYPKNLTIQQSHEKNEGLKHGVVNAPNSVFSAPPAAAIQNPGRKTKEANSDDDTMSVGASNTISNSATEPSVIGSTAIPDSKYTCLGEGCVVSCKKWKPMKLHMNNCRYFPGDFSAFCPKNLTNQQSREKNEGLKQGVVNVPTSAFSAPSAAAMQKPDKKTRTKVTSPKTVLSTPSTEMFPDSRYTCLGEGCVVSCKKWKPMMLHMENCQYFVHGHFYGHSRNLKIQQSSEKNKSLKQGVVNAPTTKDKGGTKMDQKKKPPPLSQNKNIKNLENKPMKKRRKKYSKKIGIDDLWDCIVIPIINFVFVFSFSRYEESHNEHVEMTDKECRIAEQRSKRQADTQWDLALLGRYSELRAAGASRGQRRWLRRDRTWNNYAALPPPILTKHARQRLAERGSVVVPRFVNGTHRSVVATFVPNNNPAAAKRRHAKLNHRLLIHNKKCEHKAELERKIHKLKYKATSVRKQRLIKPKLIERRNAMLTSDYAKSGPAHHLYRPSLIQSFRPLYPSMGSCRAVTNIAQLYPALGIRRTEISALLPKETEVKKKKQEGNLGELFACLGEDCSFTSSSWAPITCGNMQKCGLYRRVTKGGKTQSRYKATQPRSEATQPRSAQIVVADHECQNDVRRERDAVKFSLQQSLGSRTMCYGQLISDDQKASLWEAIDNQLGKGKRK